MLIPIYDENQAIKKTAFVTIALLVINVVVFFFLETESMVLGYGLIPQEILTNTDFIQPIKIAHLNESIPQAPGPTPIFLTIISSMFLHGDIWHLLGNMLFLWIFADNIENIWGSSKFIFFYLLCGVGAAFAQIASDMGSVSPMIGASGAISGVMGAYLVLFPRNKIRMLFFYFIRFNVSAWVLLIIWFAMQALAGFAPSEEGDNVAYSAHIGGFVVGVVYALFNRKKIIKDEVTTIINP